jgi:tRNA threonylcarbamoyladenosine biosynthesis protein TsaB
MRTHATILLALDTSTRSVGVALYDGAQVLNETVWTSQDYHTVELAPAVLQALKSAGVTVHDLAALGVATGPGSFTGLRVGLSLAKGLAMARGLPLVGVPTLDFLAAAQPAMGMPLAATLRAGRGRLAVGWYLFTKHAWQPTQKVEVLTLEELRLKINEPTWVCGELSKEDREYLAAEQSNIHIASPAGSLRHPSYLAELAWKCWKAGQVDNPATLAPIYLHYNDPIPV